MCHEVWVFYHEWTTNYKNYSKLEREHATQSFYSSVILHATLQPEDECPAQRLDYDRTNLLQNHKPKAVFFDFIFLIKSSRCMLVEYWKTYPKIFPLCRKPMYSVFYSVHTIYTVYLGWKNERWKYSYLRYQTLKPTRCYAHANIEESQLIMLSDKQLWEPSGHNLWAISVATQC